MEQYLMDAITNGGTEAAIEIHNSMVKSGAIVPSQKLAIQMASIIVKMIVIEIKKAEAGSRPEERGGER